MPRAQPALDGCTRAPCWCFGSTLPLGTTLCNDRGPHRMTFSAGRISEMRKKTARPPSGTCDRQARAKARAGGAGAWPGQARQQCGREGRQPARPLRPAAADGASPRARGTAVRWRAACKSLRQPFRARLRRPPRDQARGDELALQAAARPGARRTPLGAPTIPACPALLGLSPTLMRQPRALKSV